MIVSTFTMGAIGAPATLGKRKRFAASTPAVSAATRVAAASTAGRTLGRRPAPAPAAPAPTPAPRPLGRRQVAPSSAPPTVVPVTVVEPAPMVGSGGAWTPAEVTSSAGTEPALMPVRDASVSASFSLPDGAVYALMALGVGVAGVILWRRRKGSR